MIAYPDKPVYQEGFRSESQRLEKKIEQETASSDVKAKTVEIPQGALNMSNTVDIQQIR